MINYTIFNDGDQYFLNALGDLDTDVQEKIKYRFNFVFDAIEGFENLQKGHEVCIGIQMWDFKFDEVVVVCEDNDKVERILDYLLSDYFVENTELYDELEDYSFTEDLKTYFSNLKSRGVLR